MNLGIRSRLFLALSAILAVAVYLVVVDYGMSAGRIHKGVDIVGVTPSVGGLTVNEALEIVTPRGEELENAPVAFLARGFDCRFSPTELGWRSRPYATVQQALSVGRSGGIFTSLAERGRSWTSGVTVEWADGPNSRRMGRFLKECAELAEAFEIEVDVDRLRQEAKRAIVTWPRRYFELPVEATG